MTIYNSHKSWCEQVYRDILNKELHVAKRSGDKIPYTTKDGTFNDQYAIAPGSWTNGFWMGLLWLLYLEIGEETLREQATRLEAKLDAVLHDSDMTDHDVGFLWHLSSVANWRITGNLESRRRGLLAANHLLSRFNPGAGFFTAWNAKEKEGWSIIDTMMNLPLLYWASEETGYSRYREAAVCHADKVLGNAIRSDGSVIHVIEYDLVNGNMLQSMGGQGYGVGSSWTRGQAWAIYGFILSHRYTGNQVYLDVAKRVAHYFLAAVAAFDNIPPVDFRSPSEPLYLDTTAGAIAASGLLEIARTLEGTEEGNLYFEGAMRLLKALVKDQIDFSDDCDALLHNGSAGYPPRPVHIDIIYGDYYFTEAICKLCGKDHNMW